MKTKERHHLKQNEFVRTFALAVEFARVHRDRLILAGSSVLIVALIVGGYVWMQQRTQDEAGALFGVAMSIYEAPIEPPPTIPGAKQTPGTYPSATARYEAALAAFQSVSSSYPSTTSGLGAEYQTGEVLMSLGRFPEAEQTYQQVIDRAGKNFYGPLAKMGLAQAYNAAGVYDKAIAVFQELAAQRDGELPVDGVLMQLAAVQAKAGKSPDARATLKRVVDEFPDSPYVADARQQLAAAG